METRGFVVPASQGRVWEMAAGRSSALKLLGAETGESVMMFEETAPSGSDVVAPGEAQYFRCGLGSRHFAAIPRSQCARSR